MSGNSLSILVACLTAAIGRPASQPALQAEVDPRVELMSIIFRLAGNPEYNHPRSPSPYAAEVDRKFTLFRNHPAVETAARLRAERGISYDAVMSMAVHLSGTRALNERTPFNKSDPDLDPRWRAAEARDFLAKTRRFVVDSGFNDFFKAHETSYESAAERMTRAVAKTGCIEWFDRFFGPRPRARFHVIVGMLNGPHSYASRLRLADGRQELYAILGADEFDERGIPVFSDVSRLLFHEFCHTYTNGFVNMYASLLEPAGTELFRYREEVMRRQAYGSWQTVLYESLVRACTVRYILATKGKTAADQAIEYERNRGFSWVKELSDCLGEYESQRDRYPDFDRFMPKVVDFFNDYVEKLRSRLARAPKVLAMSPANGATDVDPAITEIKITFDRPMVNGSWALVGGGPNYPETTGKPSYDKECRVLTVPVRLKPDWEYRFWLNSTQYDAFRSQESIPLEPVGVRFRTRAP